VHRVRVLTFLHSFEAGGVERVALRLVRHWRELGIDAPLFLGRATGEMASDVGHDLDFITPWQPPIPTARWETLWMILTLPGVVRRLRPDVLFCAGNTYTIVAVMLKLLLGSDCPPVLAKISNDLDRRDLPWWRRLPYRLWLRFQGPFLDHVIAMDTPMADEIQDALRLAPGAITVIPDPALSLSQIDRLAQIPSPPKTQSDGRRFVAVGRLAAQKNVGLMLRAFLRGAGPSDSLVIIGDGPERAKLERLTTELGLGNRVDFRGYVADPLSLMAQFDVLLLSSNYEGVPAVVLEALAARLRVVATNCSRSMRHLLQDGAFGELVPVGDELTLAVAIDRADPASPDEALRLTQIRRFTLEHAASAYLQAMLGLASQNAATAVSRAHGATSLSLHRGSFGDIPA
jgi:glycosyltransferase involved in cell wall biosynthesis